MTQRLAAKVKFDSLGPTRWKERPDSSRLSSDPHTHIAACVHTYISTN